jgi:transglutaminase-like putative cysteine protease
MELHIVHHTHYQYGREVCLGPHLLRLCPRADAAQSLAAFTYQVDPLPIGVASNIDLDGNHTLQLWFEAQPTTHLHITTQALVHTQRDNPYDFILAPWATQLPIDYPHSLAQQLAPYQQAVTDPIVHNLARHCYEAAQGQTMAFVQHLNDTIYNHCHYGQRESGPPLLPGTTWQRQQGSCRDLATLHMAACRAMGLATRFVSGYERGHPSAENQLHAWVEVYLPGGGWRGWDPTLGLAVAQDHVAVAASAYPAYTMPVVGEVIGSPAGTQLTYQVTVQAKESLASP